MTDTIYQGDALTTLRTFPDCSVQCCVTSPPYYNLRDYGIDGQIGLEATPREYIEKLVQVFREVRRVLKPDGVCWLNIGDSYASSSSHENKVFGNPEFNANRPSRESTKVPKHTLPDGMKPKDLMMIPARVAIALCDDGWYLRQDIIWNKSNAMPESVTDRPTTSHEHVFLLAKSERYYYDIDAIREPHTLEVRVQGRVPNFAPHQWIPDGADFGNHNRSGGDGVGFHVNGRNKRSVWTIASQPYNAAHFATMPPKLVEPCILAGSRPGDTVIDPFAGAGTVPMVALQHGRQYIGIELNPDYITLANERIATIQPVLWSFTEEAS